MKQYYTPQGLSDWLIAQLPEGQYESAIDICCGSWNLLRAAQKRWSSLDITGIDIDADVEHYQLSGSHFINMDGLKYASDIASGRKYSIVLSNPPFGRFLDAPCEVKKYKTRRKEYAFIQENMAICAADAVLLFILPITFFTGSSHEKLRKTMVNNYSVKGLYILPHNAFGKSCIATGAIILTKSNEKEDYIRCFHANQDENGVWKSVKENIIRTESFILGELSPSTSYQLDICTPSETFVYRGNISTQQMCIHGKKEVYHSSGNIDETGWHPAIRTYNDHQKNHNFKKAYKGDVLINRVGKHCGYWCICTEEKEISDCIIVIHNPSTHVVDTLKQCSNCGKLDINKRGLTVEYVCAKDIKKLIGL